MRERLVRLGLLIVAVLNMGLNMGAPDPDHGVN
jgi:hypothetical protein